MKITEDCLKCIVYYETGGKPENYLTAYWDSLGKVWTIGIGSTLRMDGTPVQKGDKITLKEAYDLLQRHIDKQIEPKLTKLVGEIPDNQLAAFISFIYNVGINGFENSTLLKFHKEKKPASEIARAFGMWNKAKGVIYTGLVARRMTEAELYNTNKLVFYKYVKKTGEYIKI